MKSRNKRRNIKPKFSRSTENKGGKKKGKKSRETKKLKLQKKRRKPTKKTLKKKIETRQIFFNYKK